MVTLLRVVLALILIGLVVLFVRHEEWRQALWPADIEPITKGVYTGPPDAPLDEAQVEGLQQRVRDQTY
ncbi:MAG: hypothetical protein KDE35_03770 [Geminicoccaceae bacterium]|nr:hypothetical protein [Geminicoccaceae bacterium]